MEVLRWILYHHVESTSKDQVMHEAAIVENVIAAVEDLIAKGEVTGTVRAVVLRVGRLTAVIPENLRFIFGVLAEGTAMEGAELEIEEVPIRGACASCKAEFEIPGVDFLCPRCLSGDVVLRSGRELMIEAVEVE